MWVCVCVYIYWSWFLRGGFGFACIAVIMNEHCDSCILKCVNELSWLTHTYTHTFIFILNLASCRNLLLSGISLISFNTWTFHKWPLILTHTHAYAHACTCSTNLTLSHCCRWLLSPPSPIRILTLSLSFLLRCGLRRPGEEHNERICQKHEKLHAPKYAQTHAYIYMHTYMHLARSLAFGSYYAACSHTRTQRRRAVVSFKLILAFFMCLHSRRLVSMTTQTRIF